MLFIERMDGLPGRGHSDLFSAINTVASAQRALDITLNSYIIVFTVYARLAENQTILPASAGHAESSSRSSAPQHFSGQRVFRSARPGAGKVRDAPASGGRQAASQPDCKNVRPLTAVVLSGTSRISGNWSCRTVAAQTRATIRAQVNEPADAVCGATSGGRTGNLQPSTGGTNRTAFRHLGSPAQHRSSVTASKKTSVSAQPTADPFTDRRLVAAYEELRSQAVQGWRQGPALAIMITRGFRGWMEACSQLLASEGSRSQGPEAPATSMPSSVRSEFLVVLASTVLQRVSKGIA